MKLKNKWGEKNQTQVYTVFLQYLLLYDLINLDWGCTVLFEIWIIPIGWNWKKYIWNDLS